MKLVKTNLVFHDDGTPQFAIDTPPEHIKLHCILLAVAKSKGGKTFFITHLLNWLKFDLVAVITPTFESNSGQFKKMNVQPEHVFDPDDPDVVAKITALVEKERDDLLEYRRKVQMVKELKEVYRHPRNLLENYDLFSEYVDLFGGWIKPEHKWNGRKPRIAVFVDDAQSTAIFRNRRFLNLTTRHRHVGSMPGDEPSIGLSLFIAVQNYTATGGGLPKAIRGNATHLALWRTKNAKELKLISEEMAGEVSPEEFLSVYEYIMGDEGDKYAMMFTDLHRKDEHPSMFRKNYKDFVVLPPKSAENSKESTPKN